MEKYFFLLLFFATSFINGQNSSSALLLGFYNTIIDDIRESMPPGYEFLIDADGKYVKDANGRYILVKKESDGFVSFIYDDGNISDYTIVKPVFDAQNEVANASIVVSLIGASGFTNRTQILALQSAGWEILSHSARHIRLTEFDTDGIINQLDSSRSCLRDSGFTITNFMYPYGISGENEEIRALTAERYRSAGALVNLTGVGNKKETLRLFEYIRLPGDVAADLPLRQTYVDSIKSQKYWTVFYGHSVDAAYATQLNSFIDLLQASNVKILTVNKALDRLGVLPYNPIN